MLLLFFVIKQSKEDMYLKMHFQESASEKKCVSAVIGHRFEKGSDKRRY